MTLSGKVEHWGDKRKSGKIGSPGGAASLGGTASTRPSPVDWRRLVVRAGQRCGRARRARQRRLSARARMSFARAAGVSVSCRSPDGAGSTRSATARAARVAEIHVQAVDQVRHAGIIAADRETAQALPQFGQHDRIVLIGAVVVGPRTGRPDAVPGFVTRFAFPNPPATGRPGSGARSCRAWREAVDRGREWCWPARRSVALLSRRVTIRQPGTRRPVDRHAM